MILLFYFMGMVVFYTIAFFAIRWLMRRYLSDSGKSWHVWARRGIWSGLFVLMTFDQFYYYFVVVRGHCIPDKTRVYPAPPLERYVAGPYPKDAPELANYNPDVSHIVKKTGSDLIYGFWPCVDAKTEKAGMCAIKPMLNWAGYSRAFLLGAERVGSQTIDEKGTVYQEAVHYKQGGHWLTKMLTGYRINIFGYRDHQCNIRYETKETPMIIN